MSSPLPTREQALALLRKNHCPRQVVAHCKAVSKLATQTAEALQNRGYKVDVSLVEVAALLHDIGRSRIQNVHHVVEGVEISKSEGLPESVTAIIRSHVGGGITDVEAEKLGWPEEDYMPSTLEQKVVSYADKLVETGDERVPLEDTLVKFQSRGLTDSAERMRKLHDEIEHMLGEKQ